jgi:hypothetical protein
MILGFKKQFAGFVENGTKHHTIRAIRKRPFRVGDSLDMYTNVRQKNMRLLRREWCTRIQVVEIYFRETVPPMSPMSTELVIEIDGVELTRDETESFAWADGFREEHAYRRWSYTTQMGWFWIREHKLFVGERWTGQLVHWKPTTAGKRGFPRVR